MSAQDRLLAAGLATTIGVAAAYGSSYFDDSLHVGESRWVHQMVPVGGGYVSVGERCFIDRGAALIINAGVVKYQNDRSNGNECPDSAFIDLSPQQAITQNEKYQDFMWYRKEITRQINFMNQPVGRPVKAAVSWQIVVNPTPVEQSYADGVRRLEYGDSCIVDGNVQSIGQLITSELVMRVIKPDQTVGNFCPEGTLYLKVVE